MVLYFSGQAISTYWLFGEGQVLYDHSHAICDQRRSFPRIMVQYFEVYISLPEHSSVFSQRRQGSICKCIDGISKCNERAVQHVNISLYT